MLNHSTVAFRTLVLFLILGIVGCGSGEPRYTIIRNDVGEGIIGEEKLVILDQRTGDIYTNLCPLKKGCMQYQWRKRVSHSAPEPFSKDDFEKR